MESYAEGESTPLLLEETIGANFERTVGTHPDREALVEVASGRRWTWRELNHDVTVLARGLIAAGIGKGDGVGIWAPLFVAPSTSAARARRARVVWRCQPVQERTSYSSRPTRCLASSKTSSMVQRARTFRPSPEQAETFPVSSTPKRQRLGTRSAV